MNELKLSEVGIQKYNAEWSKCAGADDRVSHPDYLRLGRLWWTLFHEDQRQIFRDTGEHQRVSMRKTTKGKADRVRYACPVCSQQAEMDHTPMRSPLSCDGKALGGFHGMCSFNVRVLGSPEI